MMEHKQSVLKEVATDLDDTTMEAQCALGKLREALADGVVEPREEATVKSALGVLAFHCAVVRRRAGTIAEHDRMVKRLAYRTVFGPGVQTASGGAEPPEAA